jgi:succinyl-CoA synthetase beta subunit
MDLIETAIKQGQNALSEFRSKQFLSAHGIPVTRESLAETSEEAVARAGEIGYPVALKACSPDLMHKTEKGLIRLNLRDEQDVRRAYENIAGAADMPLEGILVQEMISGQRELVLGLIRDAQFGPCVMLGLGGIMTEILKDTVFRVAPLSMADARDMTEEQKSKDIFGAFRGQEAADLDTICRTLITLGEIGLQNKAIQEIDINPLLINPKGRVKAVDALVVLGSTAHELG